MRPFSPSAGRPGPRRPAGRIDWAARDGNGWLLGGWAAPARGRTFSAIRARWSEAELAPVKMVERPDLREHLYWLDHPERSGFTARIPQQAPDGRLEVTCERGDTVVARMSTAFLAPELERAELPPDALAERVSGLSGESFRLSGLRIFSDVWDELSRLVPDPGSARLLDWGCGCGRVARYLARAGLNDLSGCDLDAEAVTWCQRNLPGQFVCSETEPPLPFGPDSFDVVLAGSVFTHLSRREQSVWLEELARVLRPGGLLLASVAGQYAHALGSSRLLPQGFRPGSHRARLVWLQRRARLMWAGIVDHHLNEAIDGVAPAGYYRDVFQTRRYLARAWTERFELVSYEELGVAGHQDLAVLRSLPLCTTSDLPAQTSSCP